MASLLKKAKHCAKTPPGEQVFRVSRLFSLNPGTRPPAAGHHLTDPFIRSNPLLHQPNASRLISLSGNPAARMCACVTSMG